MDINNLILDIKENFPDKAIDIYESMDLLLETIKDTMDTIQEKVTSEMNDRNFDKVSEFVKIIQELHRYESKLDNILDNINTDNVENSELNLIVKKEIPNYEEYRVDSSIEHTLKEDFTHKRPSSFKIGDDYSSIISTWQEMMLDTCKYLIKIDINKFTQLPSKSRLNGKKSAYFSTNKKVMRKPVLVGEGIYVESNMSANGIRNLIIKLLKEFNIPTNSFTIYLKADYTNLSNQLSLEI